ncbi:MAG: hypothetical protein ACM3NN_00935, partial [Nitrospirota bacterium]
MPSEPKKPIEQMLEAMAKARRAEFGDDPKMPNPMRVRLHEEIARTGAAQDEDVEPRASWLTMFWPRVTVAAALATLIVLVPAIWWNQSHRFAASNDVALRDHAAAATNGRNRAVIADEALGKAAGLSANKPGVNLPDNSQIKIEPAAKPATEAGALASSNRIAEGRSATELPSQETKGFVDKQIAAAKIQAAPAVAPPVGADSKAKSDEIVAAAPAIAEPSLGGTFKTGRQFSQRQAIQSFRNNTQVSQAANVLNTFQVQQQGNEIRVLDADGSTYTGKIEQSANSAELDSRITARRDVKKQTERYAAKSAGEGESAGPQSYFRATGYNLSLKKRIVFEGNYELPVSQQ